MTNENERVGAALAARDEALAELAEVRAELAALRLAMLSEGEPAPQRYPKGTSPGEPPLRYAVADRIHTAIAPLSRVARALFPRDRR